MAKTLKQKDEVEIVPPDDETSVDDELPINREVELPTGRGGKMISTKLQTLGDVKREMGHVYRDCQRGRMTWSNGTKAIWVLRGILSAVEVEEKYRILDNTDEDTRPVFTGLQVIGGPNPDEEENSK